MSNSAALLFVSLATLLTGCPADYCDYRTPMSCVDASTITVCNGSVDAFGQIQHLGQAPCPSSNPVCVELPNDPHNRGAICATSSTASPLCTVEGEAVCVGNAINSCADGHLVSNYGCGSKTCFDFLPDGGAPAAICASQAPVRDERCDSPVLSVCVGNDLFACSRGFRTPSSRCVSGTVCVDGQTSTTMSELDAFCSSSSSPDPLCADAPRPLLQYCAGAKAVACNTDNFETDLIDCAHGCDGGRCF